MTTASQTLFSRATVRSHDQRLQALQRANDIRVRRAAMKRQLHDRAADPVALLKEPPDWLRTMRVIAFLDAIPRFGPARTRLLMRIARVADSKTVGGISSRQRTELVNLLEAHTHA